MENNCSRNNNDIAVIGIAGKFPMANNLEEFWENLENGRDCIGDAPKSRIKDWESLIGESIKHLPQGGYLRSISQFDPQFFGILPGEAPYIDPAHRLLFETVYQALEYGGYGGSRLVDTRTGVFIAFGNSGYKELIRQGDFSMAAEIGNLPAISAGRISHMFGLRGPSLLIDTACSSSLTALHYACESLKRGECDLALVGAVNIYAYFDGKVVGIDPGIGAGTVSDTNTGKGTERDAGIDPGKDKSNRFRVFDDSAGGGTNGEGVGALLLKPLTLALADEDIVCAVIKATAVNHNGNRTGTVSGLNPESQVEVMLQALENSGISPETLSYIEASGTSSRMGDPIEIRSIGEVFSKYTDRKKFCAVGCIKGNIGHLNHTSGMAAVLKVILALQHKKIPPLAHFKTPNSYIDFKNSPVYIPEQLENWELKHGENMTRRAGINSFSFNGTNNHVILEEAPQVQSPSLPPPDRFNMVTISAKDPVSLEKLCAALKENVYAAAWDDICYTLNTGRGHHEYRIAAIFKDKKEFIGGLETLDLSGKESVNSNILYGSSLRRKKQVECRGVFLFPGGEKNLGKTDLCWDFYNKGFIASKYMEECRKFIDLEKHPQALFFAFQFALARLWMDLGIKPAFVLGFGIGKYVSKVISGKLNLEEALEICVKKGSREDFFRFDENKFTHNIELLTSKGQRLFLEIGPGSEFGPMIEKLSGKDPGFFVLPSYGLEDKEKTLLTNIALLYTQGISIDFSFLFPGRKTVLPTYPFNQRRYWVQTAPFGLERTGFKSAAVPGLLEEIPDEPDLFTGPLIPRPELSTEYEVPKTEFEKKFADILRKFFGFEQVGIHDNFFEIGINSLTMLDINRLLKKKIERDIPIVAMFEYPTIHSLGDYLNLGTEEKGTPSAQYEDQRLKVNEPDKGGDLLQQSINLLRSSDST